MDGRLLTFTWNQASWVHRRMSQAVIKSTPAQITESTVSMFELTTFSIQQQITRSVRMMSHLLQCRRHGLRPQQALDTTRRKTEILSFHRIILFKQHQTPLKTVLLKSRRQNFLHSDLLYDRKCFLILGDGFTQVPGNSGCVVSLWLQYVAGHVHQVDALSADH